MSRRLTSHEALPGEVKTRTMGTTSTASTSTAARIMYATFITVFSSLSPIVAHHVSITRYEEHRSILSYGKAAGNHEQYKRTDGGLYHRNATQHERVCA